MDNFSIMLVGKIQHNANLFLKTGIEAIVGDFKEYSNEDRLVIAFSNTQIAMELIMRAYLICTDGIDSVIDAKCLRHGESPEVLYKANRLKVIDFEKMKGILQNKNNDFVRSIDFRQILLFQEYRNKIVHLCCDFCNEDNGLSQMESVISYIINTILRFYKISSKELLVAQDNDIESFPNKLEKILGKDLFKNVLHDWSYRNIIEKIAEQYIEQIGVCPICLAKTYDMTNEYCWRCFADFSDESLGRADCSWCNSSQSIVYDRLNIHLEGNHHIMPGFCQICENKTEIFECPICGKRYDAGCTDNNTRCHEHYCLTFNEAY